MHYLLSAMGGEEVAFLNSAILADKYELINFED
jgi:hypothetical protein